jgi:hypothetical protein
MSAMSDESTTIEGHGGIIRRGVFTIYPDGTMCPPISGGDGSDEGTEGEQSDGASSESTGTESTNEQTETTNEADELKFTQSQVAEMVAKERAKAQRAAESDAAKKAERAKMDEAERLKAEKLEAEQAADARIAAANTRLIAADAKAEALAAGVKPERVGAFLKLVDTKDIDVSDDGEVDAKALKSAVTAALKVVPEFKGAAGSSGQLGGDMGGKTERAKPRNIEEAVNARLAG